METNVRRLWGQEKLTRTFEIEHPSSLPLTDLLKVARKAIKEHGYENSWMTNWTTHLAYNNDSVALTVFSIDSFDVGPR